MNANSRPRFLRHSGLRGPQESNPFTTGNTLTACGVSDGPPAPCAKWHSGFVVHQRTARRVKARGKVLANRQEVAERSWGRRGRALLMMRVRVDWGSRWKRAHPLTGAD